MIGTHMVFVDATKYLKVQDDDLENAFDDHSTHGADDKYSKASFESFQIDPTELPSNREPFRWPEFTNLFERIPKLVLILLPMFFFLVGIAVIVIVIAYNSGGADSPENDDSMEEVIVVVADVSRRAALLVPRFVRKFGALNT